MSSVDSKMDAKIQQTIQDEFVAFTLLCIAHRFNTAGEVFLKAPKPLWLIHYDRVLVMDDGKVAEFNTILNLFDRPDSIFRCLSDDAHLQRSDILKLHHDQGVD